MKVAAAQAVNDTKVSKVRRSTKSKVTPKGNCLRSMETIKSQDDRSTSEPFASVSVMTQTIVGARTSEMSVTLGVTPMEKDIQQLLPSEMVGLSQNQSGNITTQQLINKELQ